MYFVEVFIFMSENYNSDLTAKKTIKIREILSELPKFCAAYFSYMETQSTSVLTRLNYAYDLRLFFKYLTEHSDNFKNVAVNDFSQEMLNKVTVDDLYGFLDYVSVYENKNSEKVTNHEHGKARKIACIRSFFKYYYKKQVLKENVAQLLDTPKIHEKQIVRLEPNEVADLLDVIESGAGLSPKQIKLHAKTVKRDLAIFTLFLSTGIRVSELVGININDVDFGKNAFKVRRKGGNEAVLYFGEEARKALFDYVEERKSKPDFFPTSPLFVSSQNKRITVRAIQYIVKKYTAACSSINLKSISGYG